VVAVVAVVVDETAETNQTLQDKAAEEVEVQ
jgi:hypothetical protein